MVWTNPASREGTRYKAAESRNHKWELSYNRKTSTAFTSQRRYPEDPPMFSNVPLKTLRFTPAVVVAMVGLLAAVILLSPITVSLDGYSHLYNAHMLARRLGGDATARTYFVSNSPFLPSWVLPLALAALSRILSLEVSLKLLILAVGMALVGALLRATDRRVGK